MWWYNNNDVGGHMKKKKKSYNIIKVETPEDYNKLVSTNELDQPDFDKYDIYYIDSFKSIFKIFNKQHLKQVLDEFERCKTLFENSDQYKLITALKTGQDIDLEKYHEIFSKVVKNVKALKLTESVLKYIYYDSAMFSLYDIHDFVLAYDDILIRKEVLEKLHNILTKDINELYTPKNANKLITFIQDLKRVYRNIDYFLFSMENGPTAKKLRNKKDFQDLVETYFLNLNVANNKLLVMGPEGIESSLSLFMKKILKFVANRNTRSRPLKVQPNLDTKVLNIGVFSRREDVVWEAIQNENLEFIHNYKKILEYLDFFEEYDSGVKNILFVKGDIDFIKVISPKQSVNNYVFNNFFLKDEITDISKILLISVSGKLNFGSPKHEEFVNKVIDTLYILFEKNIALWRLIDDLTDLYCKLTQDDDYDLDEEEVFEEEWT